MNVHVSYIYCLPVTSVLVPRVCPGGGGKRGGGPPFSHFNSNKIPVCHRNSRGKTRTKFKFLLAEESGYMEEGEWGNCSILNFFIHDSDKIWYFLFYFNDKIEHHSFLFIQNCNYKFLQCRVQEQQQRFLNVCRRIIMDFIVSVREHLHY